MAFIAFLIGQSSHRIFYFRQKPTNKIHGVRVYIGCEVSFDKICLLTTILLVVNKFNNNTLSEKILLYLQTEWIFHGLHIRNKLTGELTLITTLLPNRNRNETKPSLYNQCTIW